MRIRRRIVAGDEEAPGAQGELGPWKPIRPLGGSGGFSIICWRIWAMVLIWSSCNCTVSASFASCSTSSPGVASNRRSRTKAPHDLDINPRRLRRAEYTGEHRHTMLCEDPGQFAPASVAGT
jgi:hypothetical protein